MANENKCDISCGKIVGIAASVTFGIAGGKFLWNVVEKKLLPFIGKKFDDGVEYVKDIKRKRTEKALKVDDEKTE